MIQKGRTSCDINTNSFALIGHKEHTHMKPKNTICLWFDKHAHDSARFYAATFPEMPMKKIDIATIEAARQG